MTAQFSYNVRTILDIVETTFVDADDLDAGMLAEAIKAGAVVEYQGQLYSASSRQGRMVLAAG